MPYQTNLAHGVREIVVGGELLDDLHVASHLYDPFTHHNVISFTLPELLQGVNLTVEEDSGVAIGGLKQRHGGFDGVESFTQALSLAGEASL